MRNIQLSDLIPTTVLMNIAKRVRIAAAKIARSKHAPLGSERDGKDKYNPLRIHISTPTITQNQTSVNLSLSAVGMAFEKGSNPHPIDARNSEAMSFAGTNAFAGYQIAVQHVDHPGFAKRPFMRGAKAKTRQANLAELRKTNLANTKLVISTMKRVV